MHGCTRFAVKMDFICGLLATALDINGAERLPRRAVAARRGDRLAQYRSGRLSDAMAKSAMPWNDMVRPDAPLLAGAYRTYLTDGDAEDQEHHRADRRQRR